MTVYENGDERFFNMKTRDLRIGVQIKTITYQGKQARDYSLPYQAGFAIVQEGRFAGIKENPAPGPIVDEYGAIISESVGDMEKRIDATILRADATRKEVRDFARENLGCKNICLYPARIRDVLEFFPSPATVVSFPHGADITDSKIKQIKVAEGFGAGEIDVVLDRVFLKSKNDDDLKKEAASIRKSTSLTLKGIVESGHLEEENIERAARILFEEGFDYIKTSTGMADIGARVKDVSIMREAAPEIKIKASGGVSSRLFAAELWRAGADVFGTSSPALLLGY